VSGNKIERMESISCKATLLVARTGNVEVKRTIKKKENWKSGSSLIEVLSQNLPGRTEEITRNFFLVAYNILSRSSYMWIVLFLQINSIAECTTLT
jgi:hypothetical protein